MNSAYCIRVWQCANQLKFYNRSSCPSFSCWNSIWVINKNGYVQSGRLRELVAYETEVVARRELTVSIDKQTSATSTSQSRPRLKFLQSPFTPTCGATTCFTNQFILSLLLLNDFICCVSTFGFINEPCYDFIWWVQVSSLRIWDINSSYNNVCSDPKFLYSPILNPCHFLVIFFHRNIPCLFPVIFSD